MDQTTAQQYLAEALTARHNLAMGAREVEIDSSDGKRVVFGQANMTELDSYIAKLSSDASARRRGPIGFRFGR